MIGQLVVEFISSKEGPKLDFLLVCSLHSVKSGGKVTSNQPMLRSMTLAEAGSNFRLVRFDHQLAGALLLVKRGRRDGGTQQWVISLTSLIQRDVKNDYHNVSKMERDTRPLHTHGEHSR